MGLLDLDIVRDLYKAIDYTVKKLFKTIGISTRYSILSILILIPLLISIFNLTNYSPLYLIAVLTGFVGSTVMTIYLTSIVYFLNKHIEFSKFHYMNVRDLFNNLKSRSELKSYNQFLEELLVLSKLSTEYIPVSLIPAYSALIFINEYIYFILFLSAYMVLCTAMLYEAVSRFNYHIILENKVEGEIHGLIQSTNRRDFVILKFNIVDIVLSIITFSIYLTYLFIRISNELMNHVNIHRSNYQELAKYIVNQIKI